MRIAGLVVAMLAVDVQNADEGHALCLTDPRLMSIFPDVRLERTYVHHADGFDLLASETPPTPELKMPIMRGSPADALKRAVQQRESLK